MELLIALYLILSLWYAYLAFVNSSWLNGVTSCCWLTCAIIWIVRLL